MFNDFLYTILVGKRKKISTKVRNLHKALIFSIVNPYFFRTESALRTNVQYVLFRTLKIVKKYGIKMLIYKRFNGVRTFVLFFFYYYGKKLKKKNIIKIHIYIPAKFDFLQDANY